MAFAKLFYLVFLSAFLPAQEEKLQPIPVNPCDLYGAVYVEETPGFARYKVFVEDVEAFSNLLVFEESSFAFASKPGHWYFTKNRTEANFTIGFTDTKAFADFSIFYTSFQSLAGCRK